jgi:hypothetical protein
MTEIFDLILSFVGKIFRLILNHLYQCLSMLKITS